ncbi:polysaccharide biosynthesis tyrosine autokinase [Dolichospermum sp. LEGE 00240]|jgi:capsular exopolysaccharide synthesis family protein|uniref:GumC family protein n=1 Tax=Dolichospermum sp. LEGE 00240 TaxID=1828603 RepID=UPI001880745A|nr:polysaccharide biosynthesis tyrosine autokinase [Dolichospermum sp. LEGE 00240]MBE9247985.1 polysaccharide biosynthesis tyrosine autokinase [Dolichospermum sp. LEGE 00240]MDM3852545.1 polysaccharide biosynthesis tyrosine autokinase [Aphanizomenon gracile PMC627.10]MDM3855940.1 polysaccharide biosynthesis tyrosine autokinase [Aphanizomenon gracile PMC649.10]MDM3859536.1 polysaccharide biosynthesis tyrosine autokinase [Aphanizomenon gracile PMC644.10]
MELQQSSISPQKYWTILNRRWLATLLITISVFIIAQLAASLKKPIYLAEGKLRFQRSNTTSSITGLGAEIGKLDPLMEQNNPLNTEVEVITSYPIIETTIKRLNLKDSQGFTLKPKLFLKNLVVKEVKGTNVIQISYNDTNPQIASQVVNEIIKVYLEQNLSSRRAEASAARQFIEKQLPKAELVVRQAESKLADFKEKNKIISLEEEASKAVQVIGDLQLRINDIQSQLANVESQYQVVIRQLGMNPKQALTMTSISQIPGVQDILKEIQQLQSQLANRQTILQENHPQIIDLQDKIASLNKVVDKRINQSIGRNNLQAEGNLQLSILQQQLSSKLVELESNRLGLANQANSLLKLQFIYKQRLNTLPKLEEQQRQLERKLQAGQSTYSLLLQKLQESRIAENQNLGNATRISDAQVPDEPISSVMISYLSSALMSILAACMTIYILEMKDKSIKTIDEAKELLELTLLGVIPTATKWKKTSKNHQANESYSQRIIIRDFPRSSISEAYRMLRANLNFISADKELKVIVVTSSVPQEGKSTVAANLATAMAQMDRQVLLIDGDLHRPVQHKIWDVINNQGLSNLIFKQEETTAIIKKVMPNLDILTSGIVPPSPASLLDSQRMATLMANFSDKYDFVIVDTPALNVAADAVTLGQMADGVLLVVRPGVVDSVNATFAKELLAKSGQNVLGQVVNGVIIKNEPHSYYYFQKEDYLQTINVQSQESVKI